MNKYDNNKYSLPYTPKMTSKRLDYREVIKAVIADKIKEKVKQYGK